MRKHSPCQVIFSVPKILTVVLLTDSILGLRRPGRGTGGTGRPRRDTHGLKQRRT